MRSKITMTKLLSASVLILMAATFTASQPQPIATQTLG